MAKIRRESGNFDAPVALLGNNKMDDLYRGMIINSDVKGPDGITVKSVKDMNIKELLHTQIFHNFFGAYASEELKHDVLIQPTTYSDKSTIELFRFTTGTTLAGTNSTLLKLSEDDLKENLFATTGLYYYRLNKIILNDFNMIFSDEKGNPIFKKFNNIYELNEFL